MKPLTKITLVIAIGVTVAGIVNTLDFHGYYAGYFVGTFIMIFYHYLLASDTL